MNKSLLNRLFRMLCGTMLALGVAQSAQAAKITWDTSYGNGGVVRVSGPYALGSPAAAAGGRLAILGNGGLIYQVSAFSWQTPLYLQRLDVNGLPTGSQLSWPDVLNARGQPMLRQPDGRLLIGAMKRNVVRDGRTYWDAALLRLDRDGNPDPSFGVAGVATIPLSTTQAAGGGDMVAAIAVDALQRILVLVTSYSYVNIEPESLTILRLDADGRLDPTYSISIDIRTEDIDVDGFNTSLSALNGNELRLDIPGQTSYFGADGRPIAAPSVANGMDSTYCDAKGQTFVGTLANGKQVYASIPSGNFDPGFSLTSAGGADRFFYCIEFSRGSAEVTPFPLLAHVGQDGNNVYFVTSTPLGTALVRVPATGSGTSHFFEAPNSVFLFPVIASRLMILDIGEQPDGSLIVATQSGNIGYAAFRIPGNMVPNAGTITVQTPQLAIGSSAPASTPATAESAGTNADASGGGGSIDALFLVCLLVLLVLRSAAREFREQSG